MSMKHGVWSLLVMLVIGQGCRVNDEAAMKEILTRLQPGMSREQVSEVFGAWGRRHFWKTEQSRVPEGRTEERQREFEIKKKDSFELLVPENLLEIIPLADGATEVAHYVFNKRNKFAVGFLFEDLMLFYDARTGILQGYGHDSLRIAGRSDLEGMEFFYKGRILAP